MVAWQLTAPKLKALRGSGRCANGANNSDCKEPAMSCDSVNLDFFIGLPSGPKSCQKSPVSAVYREGELTLSYGH